MGGLVDVAKRAIRAFHGSPHDFDRFDISKIGSGEGAQSFGHGLYFAEREGVAQTYRDKLQKTVQPHLTFDDRRVTDAMVRGMQKSADPAESYIARNYPEVLLSRGKSSYDKLYGLRDKATEQAEYWRNRLKDYEAKPPIASTYNPLDFEVFAHTNQNKADMLGEIIARTKLNKGGPTGKMYEVEIGADPKSFLDWDKPIRDQPGILNRVVDSFGGEDALLGNTKQFEKLSEETLQNRALQPQWDAMQRDPATRMGGLLTTIRQPPGTWKDMGASVKGDAFYNAVAPMDRVAASKQLLGHDVPGIRFLDGSSRRAGEGTSNYVMFDDKLIDIVRKYGLAGMLGTGAAGGALQQAPAPE